MSNVTPPPGFPVPDSGPGASSARPSTVSAASGLLYLLALISLISAVLAIYQTTFLDAATVQEIYEKHGTPTAQAETSAAGAAVSGYITAVFSLLFVALYVVLAIFVNKGKQWARITTWVIGALSVCCGAASLALTGLTDTLLGMAPESGVDTKAITDDIAALAPGWLTSVSLILTVVQLIVAIVVIVLLLLPPSNPYFRKAEPQWQPPPYPAS